MNERKLIEETETTVGYMRGELLHMIFQNEAEHFSIAKFKITETNEDISEKEIVGKGYFGHLQEGVQYTFYGQCVHHRQYGLQYEITSYETYVPNTKDGLVDYLSSDLFYGVGRKTAERIVEQLGEQAIEKIISQPTVLDQIPRLSKQVQQSLVEALQAHQGFEHIVVFLSRYGVGLKMAHKLYEKYKDETIDILKEDPYQFVFDIEQFGFQTADRIAELNGLSPTHENRIKAGCLYVLQESIQEGHVYLPIDLCVERALQLLGTHQIDGTEIHTQLNNLNEERKVIFLDDRVYLPSLYYAEDHFTSHMIRLMKDPIHTEEPISELMKMIGKIEEAEAMSYGEEQFEAIQKALENKLMILTGGPGTGKTTVIKAILQAYSMIHDIPFDIDTYESKADYPFILTAPTGRASKRLSESTGLPAVTIHRLLGWDGEDFFEKNEDNQLSGKFLIIDEFSMVDTWLAYHLFQAIPDDMQVLLVGDEDQLPSVGPGQVLADILQSDLIPSVQLNEVYRQKEGSKIIELAHEIKNDTLQSNYITNAGDFSFIDCQPQQLIDVIKQVFERALNKGISQHDIQVLAPMYRSPVGINEINRQLQEVINPYKKGGRQRRVRDVTFRVGDRVIQQVNQPEDGVYNGDIGEIVAIFKADENVDQVEQIVVTFDGKEIVYTNREYDNLMHAYCISIHKSQGSEFPIVILPVAYTYHRMLVKNLLYTAITRGKQSLIICGDKSAFMKGIQTVDTRARYTSLVERLNEQSGKLLTDQPDTVVRKAEGEKETDDLSPYDFLDE